jgi:hypothetical protein
MRRMLLAASLVLVAMGVAVPANAAPVAAVQGKLGNVVSLNGRVEVPEGKVANNVVVFHGRTIIAGKVLGSVVVFDGTTTISGDVDDHVIVFSGTVTVTETAHIGGDLVTNGEPVVANGAQIEGKRRQISNFNLFNYSFLVRFGFWLAFTVAVLVLGVLLLWLLPSPLESAARAARSLGPTIGWGLAMLFGLPIVALLVCITVVGLTLGLSLLMALWFLFSVGYVVGVYAIGRMIIKPPRSRWKAFFAGFGILRAAALVPVLGGLAWLATAIIGLGAITVAVWRSHRYVAEEDEYPAAPPALEPAPPPPVPGA